MAENKEGVKIVGRVNAKNQNEWKEKMYHTVDVAILGARSMIPVSVTPEYYHKCNVGDVFASLVNVAITSKGARFSVA